MTVYECKWGILATGGIAKTFAKDLLLEPATRGVSDVKHTIAAVASSTSAERAQKFLEDVSHPSPASVATYGDYEQLVADPHVDVIYVATPHTMHYANSLLALNAGKSVLCEKPCTLNAKQAEHLIQVARQKKLFFMEAVWTRFFPLVAQVRRLVHEEKVLGKIIRVFSDLSQPFAADVKGRMYNPELGGGAMLDLGPYPLVWQLMLLYSHPDNHNAFPKVTSSMMKTPLTGVDENTTIILDFEALHAQGIATASMSTHTAKPYCVCVQGEKGELIITQHAYRPEEYVLQLKDSKGFFAGEPKIVTVPIPGQGMHWEADETARALRDGKTESSVVTYDDTLTEMRIFDTVRAQNELKYPAELEAVQA